jgi:hypothetical protein
MSENMSDKFCGVCRHDYPGHEPNCPVYTREAQQGFVMPDSQQYSQQGMQRVNPPDLQPHQTSTFDPWTMVLDQLHEIQKNLNVIRYEVQQIKKEMER